MTRQVRVSAPLVAAARLRAALDRRRGIEPSPVIRKLAEATHITVNAEDHADLTDDVTVEVTHPDEFPITHEAARRSAERVKRAMAERAAAAEQAQHAAAKQAAADTQTTDKTGEH
jgi:hypothetical protein